MIQTTFLLLGLTVAIGLGLAAKVLREQPTPNRRLSLVGAIHGLIGLAGFVVLLIALQGPLRGLRTGSSSFGAIAAILFGVAIVIGVMIPLWFRRRRLMSAALITVHAGAAIAGFTILLAWAGLE